MDNTFILLLIIRKKINVRIFMDRYSHGMITYEEYLKADNIYDISDSTLNDFEFKYFCSFLRMIGDL